MGRNHATRFAAGLWLEPADQDYPVRPPIFATDDRSSSDDDELVQRWRQWLDA
jgi:hypothetical protein